MKNILTIFLFSTLLTVGLTTMAQTTDSTSHADRVLGDTPQKRHKGKANVLGAPIYYDTLGNVIGSQTPHDTFYHRPKHHFLNRLDYHFSSCFFEPIGMLGHDAAVGLSFSYLPRRWGFYTTGMAGFRHGYVSAGPALRLSECGDAIDWHLYGGMTFSRHFGAEIGMRIASTANPGGFCWTSFSMGIGYINQGAYVTFGLGMALSPSLLLLFW